MSTRTKQLLMVIITAACGAAIEVFGPGGLWSHAFWAPVVVALLTELRTALGLSATPSPSVGEVKARITGAVPPVGVLLLAACLGLTSCKTTQTPGPTTPVGTFGHCSSEALRTAAEGILGRVTTALSTGDYVDQIAALATEVGAAEVGCAVDLVIAEFTSKASRSDDAEVGVVLAHAQAWRGANP